MTINTTSNTKKIIDKITVKTATGLTVLPLALRLKVTTSSSFSPEKTFTLNVYSPYLAALALIVTVFVNPAGTETRELLALV